VEQAGPGHSLPLLFHKKMRKALKPGPTAMWHPRGYLRHYPPSSATRRLSRLSRLSTLALLSPTSSEGPTSTSPGQRAGAADKTNEFPVRNAGIPGQVHPPMNREDLGGIAIPWARVLSMISLLARSHSRGTTANVVFGGLYQLSLPGMLACSIAHALLGFPSPGVSDVQESVRAAEGCSIAARHCRAHYRPNRASRT
jgi:hypothetical protein